MSSTSTGGGAGSAIAATGGGAGAAVVSNGGAAGDHRRGRKTGIWERASAATDAAVSTSQDAAKAEGGGAVDVTATATFHGSPGE